MAENNWNQANLKKLKAMADKGMSTSEIGKRLGMTKNAIVGKLNRMGWNEKAKTEIVAKKTAVSVKSTKFPRAKITPLIVKKPTVKPVKTTKVDKKNAKSLPVKKDSKSSKKSLATHQNIVHHSLDLANLRSDQCRWPIGDPDSDNFHFCGKPTFVGKPYCYDHCLMAYQMTPPKKK